MKTRSLTAIIPVAILAIVYVTTQKKARCNKYLIQMMDASFVCKFYNTNIYNVARVKIKYGTNPPAPA